MTEDLFLEVKGCVPYDLTTASGRFELAKDVSSFANSDGGHLLIGFVHERLAQQRVDRIKALETFASTALDLGQIGGIVRSHIWPPIEGLTLEWLPTKQDANLGIGSIFVPKQSDDSKLFLITKVAEDGEAQKEIIVGIARRIGGDNVPLRATEIYELIRKGRDPVLQRTIRIEDKLDALTTQGSLLASTLVDNAKLLDERLKRMREG